MVHFNTLIYHGNDNVRMSCIDLMRITKVDVVTRGIGVLTRISYPPLILEIGVVCAIHIASPDKIRFSI